jgi:hypothetical protein
MSPRRQVGLGAMQQQIRKELKQATEERKDVDVRIKRLRAAEAALHGGRSPNAKVLSREKVLAYVAAHPGLRSIELADAFTVPATNMRSLLVAMKKSKEVVDHDQRWYPFEGAGQPEPRANRK